MLPLVTVLSMMTRLHQGQMSEVVPLLPPTMDTISRELHKCDSLLLKPINLPEASLRVCCYHLKRTQYLRTLARPCALSVWDFTCVLLFKNTLDSLEIFRDAKPHFQQDSLILGIKVVHLISTHFSKWLEFPRYSHPPAPLFPVAECSEQFPQACGWRCLSLLPAFL